MSIDDLGQFHDTQRAVFACSLALGHTQIPDGAGGWLVVPSGTKSVYYEGTLGDAIRAEEAIANGLDAIGMCRITVGPPLCFETPDGAHRAYVAECARLYEKWEADRAARSQHKASRTKPSTKQKSSVRPRRSAS